jgi:hypothetical protein
MTFFSTIALVLITAYYAWQAKKTVDVMEKTRMSQFTPAFKIVPKPIFCGGELGLEITNIGVGTAKNIKGKLKLTSNGEEADIFYPSLYSRESLVLSQPFKNMRLNVDTSKDNKVEISVMCEDIAGNAYEIKESFSIDYSEITKNENYTKDKIVSELQNINKEIKDLKNVIDKKKFSF